MNAMLVQFFVSDVITSLDGGDCKTLVVVRFLFCREVKCYLFIGLTTNSVKGLVTFSSDFRVSQYFGLPTDRLPTFRLSISDLFQNYITILVTLLC